MAVTAQSRCRAPGGSSTSIGDTGRRQSDISQHDMGFRHDGTSCPRRGRTTLGRPCRAAPAAGRTTTAPSQPRNPGGPPCPPPTLIRRSQDRSLRPASQDMIISPASFTKQVISAPGSPSKKRPTSSGASSAEPLGAPRHHARLEAGAILRLDEPHAHRRPSFPELRLANGPASPIRTTGAVDCVSQRVARSPPAAPEANARARTIRRSVVHSTEPGRPISQSRLPSQQ
jgi:hypothetical protein